VIAGENGRWGNNPSLICPLQFYQVESNALPLIGKVRYNRKGIERLCYTFVLYIKYGSINSWLTSEIFDLRRPHSIDAEKALIDAKQLQMAEHPDPQKIKEVSTRLAQYLPNIDPIWPRWKFFAEKWE
jgi:hypothetical protein